MTQITKNKRSGETKERCATNVSVTPPVPDQDKGTETASGVGERSYRRVSQATWEKPSVNSAYSAKIGLASQKTNKSKPRPPTRAMPWEAKKTPTWKRHKLMQKCKKGRHPGFFLTTIFLLSGCSGQLICEWQTEDEQMTELINAVLYELNYEDID